MTTPTPDWPEDIFRRLIEADVRQVAYVPDAGHARLIDLCHADERITAVPLTTEQEGVALLAGAWLGGRRGALLMQSSGVGNCVNLLSLTRTCRFPLLMLVTVRSPARRCASPAPSSTGWTSLHASARPWPRPRASPSTVRPPPRS
jgi:sulfopyruvate decarboxylase TPP-binding subunit